MAHMEALGVIVSTREIVVVDESEIRTMLLLRELDIRKVFCAG